MTDLHFKFTVSEGVPNDRVLVVLSTGLVLSSSSTLIKNNTGALLSSNAANLDFAAPNTTGSSSRAGHVFFQF